MNLSNLPRNNVNIALANYVIKQFKSIYLYPSVLVVDICQARNEFTELVSMTLVSITSISCVIFASDNYLLKPYKLNKENMVIRFRNKVIIMLGSYVRLTLGSYIIKPCKWDEKIT